MNHHRLCMCVQVIIRSSGPRLQLGINAMKTQTFDDSNRPLRAAAAFVVVDEHKDARTGPEQHRRSEAKPLNLPPRAAAAFVVRARVAWQVRAGACFTMGLETWTHRPITPHRRWRVWTPIVGPYSRTTLSRSRCHTTRVRRKTTCWPTYMKLKSKSLRDNHSQALSMSSSSSVSKKKKTVMQSTVEMHECAYKKQRKQAKINGPAVFFLANS